MLGKNKRTSDLPKKSARKNTITGITTIRSSIPHKDGRKYPHRNLVTLELKCSMTNSNQLNKDNKKPLAMSFVPTARGFVYNMDSFRAKRSLDNICDECLHSRAYIGKSPFGEYVTTRKYAMFPSMTLNTLLHNRLSIIL